MIRKYHVFDRFNQKIVGLNLHNFTFEEHRKSVTKREKRNIKMYLIKILYSR